MHPLADPEDIVFDNLKRDATDPKAQEARDKAAKERAFREHVLAEKRLLNLLNHNATYPVTISSINVVGAKKTRRSFLDRLFNPLLSKNNDVPYTLHEALNEVQTAADKLRRFDIFHDGISLFIDKPEPIDPATTATDIDVYLSVREKSRFLLKTGTDLGNTEGSAYANLQLRNLFGGAESLNFNAAAGTRTRSAYQATFESPILSNPDVRVSFDALSSSTQKVWASHEEVLQGGGAKLRWITPSSNLHEVAYSGLWRQITGLAENASPTVRSDAGDSVKSSITHTWSRDKRDNPFLPKRGYMLRTFSEIAGWGPLGGDVGFWKSELDSSAAVSIPLLGGSGDSGISLSGGFRAGVLYPLPVGFESKAKPSRVNDRFLLGGPTDVRGFRQAGLGPRDGPDSVGGDVYAAGSANLFLPVPKVGKDTPLRFQLFANGGRLLSLKGASADGMDSQSVQKSVYGAVADLANGLPSIAAGCGLVYAHPVARFELNFSLPLVLRRGEEGRKGLQFGVGINFL